MFDNASSGVDKQYDLACTLAGGSNNAYTTFDYTTYHIDLPSHQVEVGLWLESQRLSAFRIEDRQLQTQQSVVIEEINQNVFNQPYAIWRKAQQLAAYSERSSYSWDVYGSPDHVAGVTMNDASAFFGKYYLPSNSVLCISGDILPEVGIDLARKYFESIPDAQIPVVRTEFAESFRKRDTHVVVPDNVPLSATYISIHLPGFLEDELLDAEIAATYIGSGRSSILFKHLVADLRIASNVGAFLDRRAHSTLLTMYAYANDVAVTADQLATAISNCLSNAVVEDSDRMAAVNKLRTGLASDLQRASGTADSVAWTTLFWDDPRYVNNVLNKYKLVSTNRIAELVGRCSRMNEWVRVDVVPAEASHQL